MTELHGKIGSPASGIRRGQLKMGSMERIHYIHPLLLMLLMGFGFEESTLTTLVVLMLSLPASMLLILASRRLRFIL